MSVPFARDWDAEKNACIDWTNTEDILANHFTFLQVLNAHPKLQDYFKTRTEEKTKLKVLFLDPESISERVKLFKEWHQKKLLTLRAPRWCRFCGETGHTKLTCQKRLEANDTVLQNTGAPRETVLAKLQEHRKRLEQLKLLEEKTRKKTGKETNARFRNGPYNMRQQGHGGAKASDALFTDERRSGSIMSIDYEFNSGSVRVSGVGDIRYYVDRVDYGVKSIAVGDLVTLKVDNSRDFPLAVDVRPAKSVISAEDVAAFLTKCKNSTRPIDIITMLLTHKHEWFEVIRFIQLYKEQREIAKYTDAVFCLVELLTFFENREPIHLKMLESFLVLATSAGQTNGGVPFFPNIVQDALLNSPASSADTTDVFLHVSHWVEAADFIVLVSQFTNLGVASYQPMIQYIEEYLVAENRKHPTLSSLTSGALRRLARAAIPRDDRFIIPCGAEWSVPPPDPKSPFSPSNLPINGKETYTSTEEFALDHCKLLRADTFEAISRVMPAACLDLPHYKPSEETKADVEHCHLYHNVRFLGEVVTPDRDYANPTSYLLYVEPQSPKADFLRQLHHGTTIVLVTALDTTKCDDNEIFWGVISSGNAEFLKGGIIVVSPCEYSSPFSTLVQNLQRNERMGKSSHSKLLETPIFMTGYAGVTKSIHALVGPLAMTLPMKEKIVPFKEGCVPPQETSGKKLIGCIPPHCERAFNEIVRGVRARNTFDKGQEEVFKRLSSEDILLVQGPPGTGKSFIGCRVVEAHVRFKQQIASGDILQKVSIDLLKDVKNEDLLPRNGPIVVITFKNHALDEFLVDLLKSDLWSAQKSRSTGAGDKEPFPGGRKLVRVGGRSKEEQLDPHNLGSLLHGKADKAVINSLRDRIGVLHKRLDKLTKEIHYLEAGKVPRTYFQRWLTTEQLSSLPFDNRELWLAGNKYTGIFEGELPPPTHFISLLRPTIAEMLSGNVSRGLEDAASVAWAAEESGDTEDIKKSVFQEMKMEDETRELNGNLHNSYLSKEAIFLAQNPPELPSDIPTDLQSLWSLNPLQRHVYYAYLIQKTIAGKAKDCLTIMSVIEDLVQIRIHAMDEAKLSILREADVIGLTTTGCALNQNLIRSLSPSVLVVEEAAEVLESQLIACLTDSLKQIILIGDHFQLQPKIDTFLYEKVNHLNLSFFERLAQTIPPICLSEQRRMHPQLSVLVRPFYLPQPLMDHPSLLNRPFVTSSGALVTDGVPGLAERVYFWRHDYPEEDAPGSRSKINARELRMVQQLVRHLVSQGVLQSSITVITPYLGQCRVLRSVIRLSYLPDVRVSTVDLYQGDENDIIILSLVRTAKLTEFIRMRNRLIVSCSRARFGFVMVGNDALLKQCGHWANLLQHLEKEKCVGDKLPITFRENGNKVEYLEVHDTITDVALKTKLKEELKTEPQEVKIENEEEDG
ncbi:hypothetical protein AGDE_11976 [Angomonas deanei]|nr:hypothetical protein AGDE_11976 [Angomonas deanei]|eukprot:EPY25188.1 hypothetical protein AGDE_11976 [Angomonas deanei]